MKRLFAALGLAALVAGCGNDHSDPKSAQSAQNTDPFDQLKQTSMQELRLKTQTNTQWGLGKFDRWDLDQDSGQLTFSNQDGTLVVCPAQIAGSYNSADHTWAWAWANSSIVTNLRTDSLVVKKFGETNRFVQLIKPEWPATEKDAWAMAAITCKVCGSQGVYRGPVSDNLSIFMTFNKAELRKPKQ